MQAEIIAIGSELTSGAKLDTNSQWLSRELGLLGIPTGYHTTVCDTLEAGVEAFTAAARRTQVVLATGGFEWNRDLVRTFLRGPMTSPVSVPTNEGDGLTMCMRIGAALGNMREAWWMPASSGCFRSS